MAPIKFEENLREKLQERELQPRSEAWDKLAARLDQQMPQRKKNPFLWMAMAASFVGIILITSLLVQSDRGTSEIVIEDTLKNGLNQDFVQKEKTKGGGTIASEVKIEQNSIEKETPPSDVVLIAKEEKAKPGQAVKMNPKLITNEGTITGDEVAISAMEETARTEPLQSELGNTFIDKKVGEVVAEVQQMQERNKAVTLYEIDVLLAKAQRDITNQRILSSSAQKIDAKALLQDVEMELEQGFREKVFQALGKEFNRIRTAVSERNN